MDGLRGGVAGEGVFFEELGSETVHTHDYKSHLPSVDPGAAKLRVNEIFGMSLKGSYHLCVIELLFIEITHHHN